MTKDKTHCTGCGACVQTCPQNAITLVADDEGFVYPQINSSACIGCGQCDESCPDNAEGQASIAMAFRNHSADVLNGSASGGAFSAIADAFWDKNPDGIVFGASLLNEDSKDGRPKLKVRHIGVTKKEGIAALRGSKYVQSDLSGCFEQLADALNAGRQVLFSSTPCQAAAVRKLFGNRDNLVIVDIVCNGVGSPAVFEKYLDEVSLRYGDVPVSMNFRNKKYEKARGIALTFKNGGEIECTHGKDQFCKMYMTNMISRPSCYHCEYATPYRNSDLTLGDFHGLDQVAPEFGEDNASLVIAHTDKGTEYAELIKSVGNTLSVEIEQCLQPRLQNPAQEPMLRKILVKNYINMDNEMFSKRFGVMLGMTD